MCKHNNIVVAHYGLHTPEEVGCRRGCDISCRDCYKLIYDGKTDIQSVYDYIENNKSNFHTLIDLTCDNLNERYSIPSGQ